MCMKSSYFSARLDELGHPDPEDVAWFFDFGRHVVGLLVFSVCSGGVVSLI